MLTAKQEQFAKGIAEGMTQSDAYRAAYDAKKMSDNAVYREASLLMGNPKITQRLQELRDLAAKSTIMTAQQRKERLTELANDEDPNVAMRAIDLLNKMDGEYVQKVEGSLNVTKLEDLL